MVTSTPLSILYVRPDATRDEELRLLVSEAHRRHTLYTCDTLREAELRVRDHGADVLLYEMSGTEQAAYKHFVDALHRFPRLPVILLTARANEIIGIQAVRAGAQDYIVHPLPDARSFHRILQFAVSRHAGRMEAGQAIQDLRAQNEICHHVKSLAHIGVWEMDLVHQVMKVDDLFLQIAGLPDTLKELSLPNYLEKVQHSDLGRVREFFQTLPSLDHPASIVHRLVAQGHKVRHVRLAAQVVSGGVHAELRIMGYIQADPSLTGRAVLAPDRGPGRFVTLHKLQDKIMDEIGFHIRTPLFSMVNFIYLLESQPRNKQDQDAFRGLKESIQELQQYLNRLMNFSLISRDVPAIVTRAFEPARDLEMISQLMATGDREDQLDLDIRVDKTLPERVMGDPGMLLRIMTTLQDLFRNLKDVARTVTIQINAESRVGKWTHFRILCRDPFPYAEPIPFRELLQKKGLAERYDERPENENLARMHFITLQALADAMKGSLQVNQLPNGSLRLLLTLPYELAPAVKEPQPVQDWVDPIRILLVEDHFLNQIVTRKVIQSWSDHIHVDIAENGLVAVQKFREHGYDLVLMDIQMPVMNGLEASRKIREKSDVPIIALSALASDQEAQRCLEAGINAYLAKPFQPDELKSAVFRMVSILR